MWRPGSLLYPLTICAAFCQPRELRLPASVVEAKWQDGCLLTIEDDKVVVRNRAGSILLSSRPAPEGVAVRKLEVRDVAMLGPRQAAASVFAAQPLGHSANLIVFFHLDRPDKPSGYWDTGAVACGQIAGTRTGRLWCRTTGAPSRIRLYDSHRAVLAELRTPDGPATLLPAPPEDAIVWLPDARQVVELNARSGTAVARLIDGLAAGKSMATFAVLPDGRVAGLLPRRAAQSDEALSTPYELRVRDEAVNQWRLVRGFEARPRGSLIIGAGPDGLVLWNRPARLVEWVRLPE